MKSNKKNNKQNNNLNNQNEAEKDTYKVPKNGFEIKVEPLQLSTGLVETDELIELAKDSDNSFNEEQEDTVEVDNEDLLENLNEEQDDQAEDDSTLNLEEINEVVEKLNISRVDAHAEEDNSSNLRKKDLINESLDSEDKAEDKNRDNNAEDEEFTEQEAEIDLDKSKENSDENSDESSTENLDETDETDEQNVKQNDDHKTDKGDKSLQDKASDVAGSHAEKVLDENRKIDIKASTKSAIEKVSDSSKNFFEKTKIHWKNRKLEKAKFEAALSTTQKEKIQKRKAAGSLILIATIIAIVINIVWAKIPVESLNLSRYTLNGVFFKDLLNYLLAMLIPSAIVFKRFSLKQEEIFGKTKQNSIAFILTALMGIPLALAITGLHNLTIFLLDKVGVSVTFKNHFAINESPSFLGFTLMLLVLVLIPAIVEEFMFRGVLQTSLKNQERLHLSMLLTATASSLFFKNIMFVIVYLGIALVLSYVKEASDSLFISTVLHISILTSLLVMQYFLPLFTSAIDLKSIDGRSKFYISLILAVVAIVLLIPIFKASFSAYADSRIDKEDEETNSDDSIELQDEMSLVDWKFVLAMLLLLTSSTMV